MSVTQAVDLGYLWKTTLRQKAAACQGATDGRETRRPLPVRAVPGAGHGREGGSTLVLFLGDSLVSGVGGQVGRAPEPAALPRSLARHLADRTGGEVQWASVGITGADVDRLTEEGLPRLREKIVNFRAETAGTVIVVLVVGVNDLRKMKLVSYRLALRRLVDELRFIDCADQAVDAVFLPALKIAEAPILQRFPLQCFLNPICSLWEREKRKAISWFNNAQVLPFPPPPEGVAREFFFSADLMHPSSSGYDWWAQGLANQIHEQLELRKSAPSAVTRRLELEEHPLVSAFRRQSSRNICETLSVAGAVAS